MNILFIIKVKVFVPIKWSYGSPQSCLTIEPRMVIIFGACSPTSFKHMSCWYMFLEPYESTYQSNLDVGLRDVTE